MRLNDWISDLRQAAHSLRQSPGLAATAVGMLGLAIGVSAGLFSVVDTVLLQPLPYTQPDRLVYIAASAPGSEYPSEFGVAPEFYVQYKDQSRQLQDIAVYSSFTSTFRTVDRVERIRMADTTSSLFSTLGVTPILGRLPVAADESRAIVISYSLWNSWFGRDPAVVGRTYFTGGSDRTVIGVMGPNFRFPRNDTQLWMSDNLRASDIKEPGDFGMVMVGRMAPGATPASVANELTTLTRRLPERFGGTSAYARTIAQFRTVVRPLDDEMLGNVSRPLWILLAAAGIVLLIACANVANLFLVRSEGRHKEMATRRALGASRRQLVRLQLAELVIIAALAGALALLLAVAGLPLFLHLAPADIPRIDEVRIGPMTLLFTVVAALVSAMLCGGVPALRGSRPDLNRLRDGGRGSTRQRHWLRHGLVVGQTALALVLLIGSGLLMRSAWDLRHVDPGYQTKDILTFQIAPDRPSLKDAQSFARFNLAFLDRLKALPGVQSAGLIENVPLDEETDSMRIRTETPGGDAGEGTLVHFTFTAGDYFKTMGIGVRGGRTFTADDQGTSRGNVIVSQSTAKRLWPGLDPIGRRLKRQGSDIWETVVGVVDDVMQDGFQSGPQGVIYFPMVDPTTSGGRRVSSPGYVIKTTRAETIAPEVRALVREVAPEAPMYRVFTMATLVKDSMTQLSFTLLTLGIASLLSLVLGAVGLYGVLSYIVAERTREIGVRMALGAQARQVRSMVVAQGARVVGAGILAGVLAALAFTRLLGGLLYGVQPIDVSTFAAMAVIMAVVGLLASYLPARRASNMDPMTCLHRE